jgi:hypothetical protein
MKIGDRVGAILSSSGNDVLFFGYGVYEGNKVPPPEVTGWLADTCREIGHENPCILLDSGKRVYGCECWWGSEEEVQKRLFERNIEIVDIDSYRRIE